MKYFVLITLMLFMLLSHAQEGKSDLSPAETVAAWNDALTNGDHKLAKKYTSKTSKKYIKKEFGSLKSLAGIYQKSLSKKRDIEEEKINGKESIVTYVVHYGNGTVKRWIDKLFLEKGKWKVAPQFVNSSVVTLEEPEIFTIVEQMPEFKGGQSALFRYLADNIKYPSQAKANGIQGRVYVSFVIDKTGNVTNAKILRGIGGGCDQESLRVVNAMPKWIPGKQRGKLVVVQYNLPIRFKL
ncbi:MAG: hypothetical protein COA57_15655 [Flavobacteriales bacterium]|nr:energy transducer TonB [Bacteroidia bacterium]PCJ79416.1 MAG: hypothetical protein COA57_15655 [Flavobacteriales bacterium]